MNKNMFVKKKQKQKQKTKQKKKKKNCKVAFMVKTNNNKPDGLLTDTVRTLYELYIIIDV